MLMLALSVPKPITHDGYPQALCNLYPFHNDLGHILQSILSLIRIIHRVTPPYMTASPSLPRALETAEILSDLWQDVYRLYELTEDIVSDCGVHFTSWVWQVFCKRLISVSQITIPNLMAKQKDSVKI